MTRFCTFATAAALAACIGTNAWSQGGQSGAGATSGSAAGTANEPGTAGTTATGQAGTGQFQTQSNVPGQRQFGPPPRPGFNFNGPSQTPFFTDPGVRQQLNLNDNQFNTLNRAHMDAFRRFDQGANALGNNLTEQQRMQQLQALQARFNQEFGQSLDTTFTDPRLRQRFNQLNTQFQGVNAFNDPLVRRQLNLTPAQLNQLRRLNAAWRQRLQQLRRAGNDAQITQEQFNQLQAQNMAQINAVLTPQQQQLWAQLTGQPFSFSTQLYLGPQMVPTAPGVSGTAGQGTVANPGNATQGTHGQADQSSIESQQDIVR